MQKEKYTAGLIPKIQTQVNAQKHKKIQDVMHAAIVASLVQMQDPSSLLSLQAGVPLKRKVDSIKPQRREQPQFERRGTQF